MIQVDYERTAKFIESIIGFEMTIRGWAVTLWLGLLGFAFDRDLWQLGAPAVVVTAVLALVDAYHANLYSQAVQHARAIEDVSVMYFAFLNHGDDDPDALDELHVRLAGHRFGLYTDLWAFRFRDVKYARPAVFFRLVYPVMLALAAACALIISR